MSSAALQPAQPRRESRLAIVSLVSCQPTQIRPQRPRAYWRPQAHGAFPTPEDRPAQRASRAGLYEGEKSGDRVGDGSRQSNRRGFVGSR